MLKKNKNLFFCFRGAFPEDKSAFVFFGPKPQRIETNVETSELPHSADLPYDQTSNLNDNIVTLLAKAMRERYRDYISVDILRKIDLKSLADKTKKIQRMQLNNGTVTFLDDGGKAIANFNVKDQLKEIVETHREERRACVHRKSQNDRLYVFRYASFADRLMASSGNVTRYPSYAMAPRLPTERGPFGGAVQPQLASKRVAPFESPVSPPLDPKQKEALAKLQQLFAEGKETRDNILRSVETNLDKEYEMRKFIDPEVQNAALSKESFEKLWPKFDYSYLTDRLFREVPTAASGYTVNPFKEMKGVSHVEWLRQLMLWGRNDRMYLREVLEALYSKRFDEFTKDLTSRGVPKEVIKLLHEGDALRTYKELREIYVQMDTQDEKNLPEKVRKLAPYKDSIKLTIDIFGDYIAYSTKLINLVEAMKFNPAPLTLDRRRTMDELAPEDTPEGRAENRVKRGMKAFFMEDTDVPKEYKGELNHLFAGRWEKPITFRDLNGATKTLPPRDKFDTATLWQSAETAYKFAIEAAETEGKFDELSAIKYSNDMLQLGIAAYNVLPQAKRLSLKTIIDQLVEVGAEVEDSVPLKFLGEEKSDLRNLYHVLSLKTLDDPLKGGAKLTDLISKYRKIFCHFGSVIHQKTMAQSQERLTQERKAASLKFRKQDAQSVVEQLAKIEPPKFTPEQLAKIEEKLVGGAFVVLPDQGGAFSLSIPFENDVSISITGALPQWNSYATGASVGKKFEVNDSVEISINVGVGYHFGAASGWGAGVGGSMTKKFSKVDLYVEGGAGVVTGTGLTPTAYLGLGLNWGKYKENFQKRLTELEVKHHVEELDKSGNPYDMVAKNRSRYPEFSDILYNIENAKLQLAQSSERDVFNAAYSVFKEGLQKEAIDDTVDVWYKRLLPTSISVGTIVVGSVVIPYAYMTWQLYNRKWVARLSTDVHEVETASDAQVTQALREKYAAEGTQVTVNPQTLRSNASLLFDPKSKELLISSSSDQKVDFSYLDTDVRAWERLRKEFASVKIGIEEPNDEERKLGLIRLTPYEAHGNIYAWADPGLRDQGVLVTRGNNLYVSVKKGSQVFCKRRDITYPMRYNGVVEETFITFANNYELTQDTIEQNSGSFFYREPESNWVARPSTFIRTPDEAAQKRAANNTLTWEEYKARGFTDRVGFASASEALSGKYEAAYQRLAHSVEIADKEKTHLELRKDYIEQAIANFKGDKDFMAKYKRLSTQPYLDDKADWVENFPELIKLIAEKVPDLNALELHVVMSELLIASFSELQDRKGKDKATIFKELLLPFQRKMLKAIFSTYYDGQPDRDKKAEEATEYIIKQYEGTDITKDGESVPANTSFGTVVGTYDKPKKQGGFQITGIRRDYNFAEERDKYGVLDRKALDPKAKDVSGRVGEFWLKKLSPYEPGLGEKSIPETSNAQEYAEYQEQIRANLSSPLALKLVRWIGRTLEPTEMDTLSSIYENIRDSNPIEITSGNRAVVQKFLGLCDRVREAELKGERTVPLNKYCTLVITDFDVSMGLYKKCTNITGLVREQFGLNITQEGTEQSIMYADMREWTHDIRARYGASVYNVLIGLGPAIQTETVGGGPPPTTPDQPPARMKIPPETPQPPTVTRVPPPDVTKVPTPGKSNVPDSGRTSGR